jgi:hypothetical protein
MATPAAPALSDFDAAKSIADILTGMEKAQQERVLRWVAESLGLSATPPVVTPHTPHTQLAPPSPHTPPHTPGAATGGGHLPTGTPNDIKSFVDSKKPKTNNQFAAVVAYYHQLVAPTRKSGISAEDIKEATRQAGWPRFTRPDMPLTNAMQQGYLDKGAERGEYKLNAVGENLVAMTLPDGDARASNRKKSSGRKTAKKSPAKKK